jgi:hypothetical protein
MNHGLEFFWSPDIDIRFPFSRLSMYGLRRHRASASCIEQHAAMSPPANVSSCQTISDAIKRIVRHTYGVMKGSAL